MFLASIGERWPARSLAQEVARNKYGASSECIATVLDALEDLSYPELLRMFVMEVASPSTIVEMFRPPEDLRTLLRMLVEPGTTCSTIVVTTAEVKGLLGADVQQQVAALSEGLGKALPVRPGGPTVSNPLALATTLVLDAELPAVALALQKLGPMLRPTVNI